MSRIHVNASFSKGGFQYIYRLTSSTEDLSVVDGGEILVRSPSGALSAWPAVASEITAAGVTLTHDYLGPDEPMPDDPGDVPTIGFWNCYPRATQGATTVAFGVDDTLEVFDPFTGGT